MYRHCYWSNEDKCIKLRTWNKEGKRLTVDVPFKPYLYIDSPRGEYMSIFDDPYLAMYRDLHDRYGSHVHMHIYYQTVDGNFNLSMFPDKYKAEFQANSMRQ